MGIQYITNKMELIIIISDKPFNEEACQLNGKPFGAKHMML